MTTWNPPAASTPVHRSGGQIAGGIVLMLGGVIVCLFCAVLLLGSFVLSNKHHVLSSRGVHAEGVILRRRALSFESDVEYTTAAGINYITPMQTPGSADRLADGRYDIVYDPQNPGVADTAQRVRDYGTVDTILRVGSGAGLAVGLAALVIGIWVLAHRPKPKPAVWVPPQMPWPPPPPLDRVGGT